MVMRMRVVRKWRMINKYYTKIKNNIIYIIFSYFPLTRIDNKKLIIHITKHKISIKQCGL